MKSLKESIFGDVDTISSNDNALIEQFLRNNYEITGSYTIKDGVVDVKGYVRVKNTNIESLTNGIFRFGNVNGGFSCPSCINLKSLKGAPEKVSLWVNCNGCRSLKTLEGSPKEVGGDFDCSYCKNLISLEGAPEKVGQEFRCGNCPGLTSLEGSPKEVRWSFVCSRCENLTSLKGAPKKVGGFIVCAKCPKLITTSRDRKKYKLKYTSEE